MPLRDDLLNPISDANPSGENLRYVAVYDQIKEARREEDDAPQGDWQHEIKRSDWVLVSKLAGDALAKKSKDLQIAAWLTEAMLHREGFLGLKAGLDLLNGLLVNFWDTLYPELEDGDSELRATPLEWVGSRLEEAIKRVPLTRGGLDWFRYKESRTVPTEADSSENETKQQARANAIEDGKLTPEEFEADFDSTPTASYQEWQNQIDGCLESIDALRTTCEEKFGSGAPTFGDLKKTLEEVRQTFRILLNTKKSREAPEVPAAEEAAAFEEGVPTAEGGAAAPRRAIAAQPVDRDDAIARVGVLARYLREQDAASPGPYLMLRGLRWGELRAAGEGADPDASLLDAPPTQVRQDLKRLALEGDWQGALEIAETAMASAAGRAWLDLQRYAASACENLGYYAAAWAIKREVRALLADFPRLTELSLTDDTPTANQDTRNWLKEFAAEAPAAAAAEYAALPPAEAPPAAPGVEAPPDPYQLALEAAHSGQLQAAFGILTREIAQERSGRGRFQRRVQLAQICVGAGQTAIALPILQELADEIERRKLEEWETPDVVAHALMLLYRCMDKTDATSEEKQKVYNQICRLDPVQAMAIRR